MEWLSKRLETTQNERIQKLPLNSLVNPHNNKTVETVTDPHHITLHTQLM
jgi:hypothetical protein